MSFWINRATPDNLLDIFHGRNEYRKITDRRKKPTSRSCFFYSIHAPLYANLSCERIAQVYSGWQDTAFPLTVFWWSYDKVFHFDGSELHMFFLINRAYKSCLVLCNTLSVFIWCRKLSLWWCFKYKCKLDRFLVALPFSLIEACSVY